MQSIRLCSPPFSPTQSAAMHGCATLQTLKATLKPPCRTRARLSAADAATYAHAPWSDHAHRVPSNGPASNAMSPLRPPKARQLWQRDEQKHHHYQIAPLRRGNLCDSSSLQGLI
ncbi:hypothetical protein HBI56_240170 [Parastagonospora nodorum]|uniref:Uncharacterized protein n=1 Tax=Phaeosphaeria nodorum (strain SN15 / ATCC MYA-4574 / FGSC 10173) TaxID=321614 RepID=A0A7U2EWG1_PHANO|nr:hypothetical protein HBH56_247370 [Parastagonospora nodorum]QRC93982.1 hypothetical protein JI435_404900 [Parastagonospora nodorum SN15]KAH3921034.1 hypothetical protein HBH54_248270 [Parastagonospora nodorum]KAH3938525.1 hypothetical protein HBH53_251580 [Parastagonospora nodorum]KAH3956189.1 hypothetical protein HBH51_249680 [Parastagonospora nodorum]